MSKQILKNGVEENFLVCPREVFLVNKLIIKEYKQAKNLVWPLPHGLGS